MKPVCLILATLFLLGVVMAPERLRAAELPRAEKEKIEALIKHLEGLKDAKFIRNGSEYDAKSAAKFIRGKWDSKEKEIKTAADFIEKAASVRARAASPM